MIDTSRFFASAMIQRFTPIMNMYSQLRPLIFLPFNIWFFFATLPFRFFFFFTSFLQTSKGSVMQMKAKVAEIKDEVNDVLPAKLKSKAPIELRPRKSQGFNEERPFHGFYTVEKSQSLEEKPVARRRSVGKNEEQAAPAPASTPKVDESASLNTKISEMEQQHQQTLNEKANLEQQLKEMTKKYESDESALSHVDTERRRFKNLISVEQRKCFDLQQQMVSLRSQLKKEQDAHASAPAPSQSEDAPKKQKKAKKATTPSDAPAQTTAPTQTELPHAWHGASHTQDYTDMVAKAQKEELDAGKTFSEVLKESIKKPEVTSGSEKGQSEFTVVGGYDSNHHIYAPMSAV